MTADGPRRRAWRLGVRLAIREMRHRPSRAVLVVVMVLLPSAAMATVVTFLRTAEQSPQQQRTAEFGAADAQAFPSSARDPSSAPVEVTEDEVADLRSQLPTSAVVVIEHRQIGRLALGDRRSYPEISDLPLGSPLTDGLFRSLQGRAPTAPREIVLTTAAAEDLGAAVGDRVTVSGSGAASEVTGIIDTRRDDQMVAYAHELPEIPLDREVLPVDGMVWVALDGHPTVTDVSRLSASLDGWDLESTEQPGVRNDAQVFWTYVGGGIGLTVLGTIIAAAFALGARRQLRTLGLLAATGASPRILARFLVVQGAVCGLVGSLSGVGLSVVATRLVPDRALRSVTHQAVDAPVLRLVDLVPIVVLGTLVAAGAAWLPARTAARVPTLQAVAGRRPLPVVPAWLPVLGALAVGVGCGLFAVAVAGARGGGSSSWAVAALVGGLALLAGVVATAPWVIARLERGSARWPQSWRLAGRSLARNRLRSSAVVGAIATVAAALVAAGTLYASLVVDPGEDRPYLLHDQLVLRSEVTRVASSVSSASSASATASSPDGESWSEPAPIPREVIDRVRATAPDAELVPIDALTFTSHGRTTPVSAELLPDAGADADADPGWDRSVSVATPALLDLFAVPADLRAALARGEAVSVLPAPYPASEVRLSVCCPAESDSAPLSVADVPLGGSFVSPQGAAGLPSILVDAATARRLGLDATPAAQTLIRLSDGHDEQRRDLELLVGDLQWEDGYLGSAADGRPSLLLDVPSDEPRVPRALVEAGIVLAALLLVLAVAAVGLAMAAEDSEDERQVLAAVGAPPRTLRQIGARRALLLTLIGAVLAVPTGLLPAVTVVAASTGPADGRQLHVDLWAIAFVLVALPLATAAGAAASGRLRDTFRPPRPDSLARTD